MRNKCIFFVLLTASLVLPTAHAEYLGLVNGRSANPGNMPNMTAELGFVTGDLGAADYQNLGARLNYRISPETVIFGDFGISEFGNADGTPFGVGVFYHLSNQRISDRLDIAAKASYHTGSYEVGGIDGDVSGLSFEALISGIEPLAASGLSWYANFGFHRLTVDFGPSDSSNEIGLGAGVYMPFGAGEVYGGFDIIDELNLGIGFRYFIQ